MRTARSLTVSPSMHCSQGGCLVPEGGCSWGNIPPCTEADPPGPRGCTWSRGVYLVLGGVPGLGGGVPAPGGCTWSGGVYLVGGVPGPRGMVVYLVPGGVPAPGGGAGGHTWSRGGVYLVPKGVYLVGGTWSGGCTWSQEGVPGLGGVCSWGDVPGRGCVRYSPPVNRMTNRCKKYYLAPNFVCGR